MLGCLTILALHLFSILALVVEGVPLTTKSRWILNEKGQRVKLACVNWVAHLDPVVVEGLSKQPVDIISNKVKEMGFNCVRLTYPIYLATNHSLASLMVEQSFTKLGLLRLLSGLQVNNPTFVNLTLIDAFQEVVRSLGRSNLMVILDNHISKPGWCCSDNDGNGFFNDAYFNPTLWIQGLSRMATLFKNDSNVVGMSLRNELRGHRQNVYDWYRYMQRGAEAIHTANPNVLVILSGLSYDTNLSYIRNRAVQLSFRNKLVYEAHWYSFSKGQKWTTTNTNEVCAKVVNGMMRNAGYLIYQGQGFPLFLSEFGINLVRMPEDDRRFMNCFIAWAVEHDFDWALWALQGSYHLRQGVVDMSEYFGVLDSNWSNPKSSSFMQQLSLIQSPLLGPGVVPSRRQSLIFHPATGLCVQRNTTKDNSNKSIQTLKLGHCSNADYWVYNSVHTLTLKGTSLVLQAYRLNNPARITTQNRTQQGMRWTPISDSKLHLSADLYTDNNSRVCLDVDSKNNVITSNCKCLSGDAKCDPMSQWFKIVNVGR